MEMENLDTLDYRDHFFITFAGSLCSLLVIFSNIYLRLDNHISTSCLISASNSLSQFFHHSVVRMEADHNQNNK